MDPIEYVAMSINRHNTNKQTLSCQHMGSVSPIKLSQVSICEQAPLHHSQLET